MAKQTRLVFDQRGPRRGKPPAHNRTPTSRIAAGLAAETAPTKREQIYAHLDRLGENGATIEEIHRALAIKESTVCGRVNELYLAGQIRKSGTIRPTSSGCPAAVWVTTK